MLAQFKDHHVQFLLVGIQLRCEVEGELSRTHKFCSMCAAAAAAPQPV